MCVINIGIVQMIFFFLEKRVNDLKSKNFFPNRQDGVCTLMFNFWNLFFFLYFHVSKSCFNILTCAPFRSFVCLFIERSLVGLEYKLIFSKEKLDEF